MRIYVASKSSLDKLGKIDGASMEGVTSSHLKDMMHSSEGGERSGTEPIASEKVTHERKVFFLDLQENQRGRFLKITEDVGGRRDTIMLPAPAFREFLEALQRLVDYEEKL
jgi:hypothetical protein